MKFGCSIPVDIFTEKSSKELGMLSESFGSKEMLFENLGSWFDVVEFSTIWPDTNEKNLYNAVCFCNRYGLSVTFHGTLEGITEASEFFAPYISLFDSCVQCSYNITIHPLSNADVKFLLYQVKIKSSPDSLVL